MEILLQNRCFLLPYHNPTTRQYNHSLFPPPVRKISTVLQQFKERPTSVIFVSTLKFYR